MNKPLSRAPIVIVEGEQGSGKSNTLVARAVDAYKKDPNIRIYANFHLFGIKYVFLPLPQLLSLLNSGLIRDGYLLIDEGYISGNAREGMSSLVRVITKMSNQIRKRHLHLYLATPNSRQLDWQFRWAQTEHIFCDFNDKTKYITLTIRKKGVRKAQIVSYYAPQYWKYYNTDEIFELPENQIAKALASVQ